MTNLNESMGSMGRQVLMAFAVVVSGSFCDSRHILHEEIHGFPSNTTLMARSAEMQHDFALAVQSRRIADVSQNISAMVRLQAMRMEASAVPTPTPSALEIKTTLFTRPEEIKLFDWGEVSVEAPANKFCGFRALCRTRFSSKVLVTEKVTTPSELYVTSSPDSMERTATALWERELGISPNVMDNSIFGATPCHCDSDCVRYGDCCQDAAQSWWGHGLEDGANQFECRSVRPSEENWKEKLSTYVFMVSHCPEDYQREDLRRLCEREVQDENYHYLLDLPVYSLDSRKTYANVYCARCNGDFHLAQWNASVECSANVKDINLSLPELMQGAVYYRGNLTWTRRVGLRSHGGWDQTVTCYLSVQEFKDVPSYLENFHARRCLPAKRTCHPLWTDKATRLKCDMYSLHVVDQSSMVYKNPHCAQCNFVDIKSLRCHRTTLRIYSEGGFSLTPSFSVIFDFVGGGGGKVGQGRTCGMNEFWDDIHAKCHAVACGTLYEIQKGKCVLAMQDVPALNESSVLNSDCYTILLYPDEFIVNQNGSIYVNETAMLYEVGQYEVSNGSGAKVCAENPGLDYYFKFSEAQSYVSQLGLAISLICLAAHIVIYTLFPKLRNMPGKNLLSLACALFMAQLLFLTGVDKNSVKSICVVIGLSLHWFYLAAFFWMSVMSFDICRTFRSKTYRPERNTRTFQLYCIYGWGGPTLTVAVGLLLDNTSFLSDFAPEYGAPLCWINSRYGLAAFFIVPVLFLLLENLTFFILTVFSIWTQQKAAKYAQQSAQRKRDPKNPAERALKQSSESGKRNRMRFYLYVKLAVIMGLTWIFGFVAAIAGVPSLWYPFIIFNSLQGAAIFVGFDVKKKILVMLWEKISGRRPIYHFLTRNSGSQSSSKTATTSFIIPHEGSQVDHAQEKRISVPIRTPKSRPPALTDFSPGHMKVKVQTRPKTVCSYPETRPCRYPPTPQTARLKNLRHSENEYTTDPIARQIRMVQAFPPKESCSASPRRTLESNHQVEQRAKIKRQNSLDAGCLGGGVDLNPARKSKSVYQIQGQSENAYF